MKKLLLILLLMPLSAFAAAPKESIFFTQNQIIAIMRANQGFIAPQAAIDDTNQGERPYDPGPRVIKLSGIVYNGPHDWTIWLNDQRVGPKNTPDHVMGLVVEKDRIHLKWMDIGQQRLVNIVLRPHQRYFLDTDTILSATE